MTTATKTTRLTLVVPEDFRRDLKEQARKQGKSPSAYVIERLSASVPKDEEFEGDDVGDVNESVAKGIYEYELHKAGKIRLSTFDEFIKAEK